jgi:hypothetical protein
MAHFPLPQFTTGYGGFWILDHGGYEGYGEII